MKRMVTVFLLILCSLSLFAGTPVIDGVFDGEDVWGPAVATADGTAGWAGVNCYHLYVTYDANYAYFAASFISGGEPASWMRAAFVVNVTTGGGGSDPWGVAVTYGYTPDDKKPDFVLIGRLGDTSNWAELRTWNGSSWDGGGVNVYPTDMNWATDLSYIEGRIPKSALGNPSLGDVQFYVSGNVDNEHGVFDACPDDEVATSWNDPTTLTNYRTDVSLPVSLTSFSAVAGDKKVTLTWSTASEIENDAFLLEKSVDGESFVTIAEIPGQGTSNAQHTYKFVDRQVLNGMTYYYRLADRDFNGNITYHQTITATPSANQTVRRNGDPVSRSFALFPNYPNPFNPSTTIRFNVPDLNKSSIYLNLSVFNVTGQKVATLYDGEITGGSYDIEWNGKDDNGNPVPSGIYIYHLRSDVFQKSHKMILVR